MSEHPIKQYPTIGCCGLDCGLCPRYYTVGTSRCPGCCGPDFWQKHPGSPILNCCVKRKGLEFCSDCSEFPCSKFKDVDKYDSFLTHQKMVSNLNFIKKYGIKKFIDQQNKRIKLLETMINNFNDGRSRSFYCIATTLLPMLSLERALDDANQKIKKDKIRMEDIKTTSKILKGFLNEVADRDGIELKLRKKVKNQ
ncbi:MAG: DUF3795 domain-containing protein [Thermoplasmatales archaeon]|nr:DUF3795 domain-containing protein [Thermoplasmatales archaeon]